MSQDLLIHWDFAKAVGFLADRKNSGVDSSDAISDSLRRRQNKEVERIHESLTSVRHKDVVTTKLMFEDALCFFQDPKCKDSAMWHFEKASTMGHDAITNSSDIVAKMEATSIATVAALFCHENDVQTAYEVCKRHIEKLHMTPEVQQVFKSKIRKTLKSKFKGMFTKRKRHQTMQTICMINFTLFRYFCSTGNVTNLKDWPTVSMPGSEVIQPVSQVMSVANKETGKVPLQGDLAELLVGDDVVLCIDDTGKEVRLWDPNEMTAGGSFQRWFPLASSLCEGSLVCVSQPLAPGQQSSVSTIDLSNFCQLERQKLPGDTNYILITVTDTTVAVIDDRGKINHLNLNDFSFRKQVRVHFPRKTDAENDRILLQKTETAVDNRFLYWWDVKTASLFKFNLLDGRKVKEVSTHAQIGLLSSNFLCAVELSNDRHISALEVRSADDLQVIFRNESPLKKSREVACAQFCAVNDGLLAVLYKSRRSYWLSVWEVTSGAQLWEKFFGGGKLSASIVSIAWYRGQFLLVALSDGTLMKYKIANDLMFGRRPLGGTLVRGATSCFNLATPGSPFPLTPGPKSRSMSNLLDSSISEF